MPLEDLIASITAKAEPEVKPAEAAADAGTTTTTTPAAKVEAKTDADERPDLEKTEHETDEVVDDKPVEPVYVPNKKYKVNGEEKEMEAWIEKALDKDTEPKLRELFEKAAGLDLIKPKLAQEREARGQAEGVFRQLQGEIANVLKYRDTDLGLFFEAVKLSPQKVAKYLVEMAERESLPPEVKAVYDERDRLNRETLRLQAEASGATQAHVDGVVQARTTQLDQVISQPTLNPVVSAFDARLGREGAFRTFVMQNADAAWRNSGGKVDYTPQQAVDEALKLIGATPAAAPAAQPPGAAPTTPAVPAKPTVIPAPAKPTVIPNIGSSTGSPTGKKPKDLASLRAMAKEVVGG